MSDLDPDKSTPQKTATCPQCGKPLPQSSVIGSLTAFLFQGSNCSCDKSSQAHNARGAQAASIGGYSDFCPRCGLARKGQSQPGSLTGYLFQDTKCRCADNENFDPVSMSQRFWKLKKEENPSFNSGANGGRPDSSGLVYVDLAEGAIIARAYQIVKLIGRGGMGEVYLAKHLTLGKPCALKVIPPGKVDEMGWQRFQAEARLLAKLEHLNLVHVVDLGIHEGCLPFYAMDFIDGLTLADMLAQNGPLSVKLATEIFMQVCDGVDFAHRNGIIHRDLKPANIMIVRSQSQAQPKAQAEKITVKILDFGLAKLTQHDRSKQSLTAVGEIFGSPFYMSPEQCSGGKIDNRSDIYSVGCALFESLTERPPFYGNQAAAIMNGHQFGDPPMLASVVGTNVFPDGLEVVVAKLLRKNPAERYQTMAELKGDLERVARGENVQPYYVSRAKGTAQKTEVSQEADQRQPNSLVGGRPSRLMLIGAMTSIIVVAGLVITFMAKGRSARRVIVQVHDQRIQRPPKVVDSALHENFRVDELEGIFEPSESLAASHSKPLAWDGKPFFKGVVNRAGTTIKLWQFPTSLGFNYGRLGIVNPDTTWVPMVADITAPASATFCIALQPAILNSPDLLNGFTDGSFDGIRFENATTPQFKQLATALARFQSIHKLDFLRIDPDSSFEQECVKVINHYPNLTKLDSRMLADGSSFSQLHRLKMLEDLALFGIEKNYDQVFLALAGSTHLTKLTLDNIPLSTAAVRALSECPNLKTVDLYLTSKDPQSQVAQIVPLADLKPLSSLEMRTLTYSPAIIDTLRKFQTLKDLKCELGKDWNRERGMSLHRALPYTDIWLASRALSRDSQDPLAQTAPGLNRKLSDNSSEPIFVHYRPTPKSALQPIK